MTLLTHPERGGLRLPRLIWPALVALVLALLPLGRAEAQTKSSKSGKKPTASASSSKVAKSKKKTTTRRSSRSRGQAAPTSDRIREIQEALARTGHYKGEPTGRWDNATSESMRRFQESQNLRATGKLDAVSLQKLGLGSPVAGLAPPSATPGSSN